MLWASEPLWSYRRLKEDKKKTSEFAKSLVFAQFLKHYVTPLRNNLTFLCYTQDGGNAPIFKSAEKSQILFPRCYLKPNTAATVVGYHVFLLLKRQKNRYLETKNSDRDYNQGGENKLALILPELLFGACETAAEWEQAQVQNIDTTPRVGRETSAGDL